MNNDRRNGWLYAAFIALITFVSNGTSTHLPEFIASFGLPVASACCGDLAKLAQALMEVMAGTRLTPLRLLLTALAMPLCFLVGLGSARNLCGRRRICAGVWCDKRAGDNSQSHAAAGVVQR
jgi:hypothetical protein